MDSTSGARAAGSLTDWLDEPPLLSDEVESHPTPSVAALETGPDAGPYHHEEPATNWFPPSCGIVKPGAVAASGTRGPGPDEYVYLDKSNSHSYHPHAAEFAHHLHMQGTLPDAILAAEAAVLEKPWLWGAWLELGIMQHKIGNERQARAAFKRAKGAHPRNVDVLLQHGISHLDNGELATALSSLSCILALLAGCSDLEAAVTASVGQELDARLRVVLVQFKEASKRHPAHVGLYRIFGALLHWNGDYLAASYEFRQALLLDDGDCTLWYLMGRSLDMRGRCWHIIATDQVMQWQRAVCMWSTALELLPTYQPAADSLRRRLRQQPQGPEAGPDLDTCLNGLANRLRTDANNIYRSTKGAQCAAVCVRALTLQHDGACWKQLEFGLNRAQAAPGLSADKLAALRMAASRRDLSALRREYVL